MYVVYLFFLTNIYKYFLTIMRNDRNSKNPDNNKQKITKSSLSSQRAPLTTTGLYHDIQFQITKFYQNQEKKLNQQKNKRQNIRQVIYQKAKINPQYDLNEGCKAEPFINNYTQPIRQNYSGVFFPERKPINNDQAMQSRASSSRKKQEIQKKCFLYKYIVGKGGFGKVWKVEHNKSKGHFAMKQMLKSIILSKKSVQSIINQQKLLSRLNSKFIVNMHYAFQDRQTLYLVLDLMDGGDLRHHINQRIFTEAQAKFIIACLLIGLEYIHRNNIIHRDIKPQNLVFDARGYLRITDFGIARVLRVDNESDTSGTPGYMSPQVICRQKHSFVSDFFAVGVIAYELMLGKRPYNGYSRAEIRQKMLAKQAGIKAFQVPEKWDHNIIDFVNRLLQRKPEQRLGYLGIDEIKNHPWLRDLNWMKIYRKEMQAPFLPFLHKSDFDQDEKITIEDEQEAELIEKNSLLLRRQEFQDLFKDYYYSVDNEERRQFKAYTQIRRKTEPRTEIKTFHNSMRARQKAYTQSSQSQSNSRQSLNGSKHQITLKIQDFLFQK